MKHSEFCDSSWCHRCTYSNNCIYSIIVDACLALSFAAQPQLHQFVTSHISSCLLYLSTWLQQQLVAIQKRISLQEKVNFNWKETSWISLKNSRLHHEAVNADQDDSRGRRCSGWETLQLKFDESVGLETLKDLKQLCKVYSCYSDRKSIRGVPWWNEAEIFIGVLSE